MSDDKTGPSNVDRFRDFATEVCVPLNLKRYCWEFGRSEHGPLFLVCCYGKVYVEVGTATGEPYNRISNDERLLDAVCGMFFAPHSLAARLAAQTQLSDEALG